MPTTWEQADVFPVIARIIADIHQSTGDFVTHDRIAEQFMADVEGSSIIRDAVAETQGARTETWMAHNMIAWFSQRITMGKSEWQGRFDRMQVAGKWAYRSKNQTTDNEGSCPAG